MDDHEVFTIPARKCMRCGRILTSKDAIEDGYGHTCKLKALGINKDNKPIKGQIEIDDLLGKG